MTGSVSTRVVTDGAGAQIPGGGRFFDVSGTGAGPWVPMSVISDLNGNAIDPTLPTAIVGNVAAGSTDSGAGVKISGIYQTSAPTYANGQRGDVRISTDGGLQIKLNGDNGAGGMSSVRAAAFGARAQTLSALAGLMAYNAPYIGNGSTADQISKPNGATRLNSSAATTNATSVKTSAGELYRVVGQNAVASVRFLKIYNKASAPVPGTDTPVLTIPLAASSVFNMDIGGTFGFYLGTGIAFAITANAADNDNTAIAAGDIVGFSLTFS